MDIQNTYDNQECMMMLLLLQREEKERVTTKNLKQAESPVCAQDRTHLPTSSQSHDLQLHNAVFTRGQQDMNTPSLPGKF